MIVDTPIHSSFWIGGGLEGLIFRRTPTRSELRGSSRTGDIPKR